MPVPAAAAPFPSASSCVQGHPPPQPPPRSASATILTLGNLPSAGIGLSATRGHVPHHLLIFSSRISKPTFSRSRLSAFLLLQFTREASTSAHTDYVPR